MAARRARPALVALTLLAACGDDDLPMTDGGADAGASVLVAPPEEAQLPRLPCPDGWRTVVGDDALGTCDPWPASGVVDCGVGEAHFPGAPGCEPLGEACPSGAFAATLPAGTETLYVDDTAPAGGTGTEAAPLRTIGEALAVASDGAVIAVAKGSYDERIVHTAGRVTLAGACAAETSLTFTTTDPFQAVLSIQGGELALRGIRITGAGAGISVSGGATVTATGVQIDDMSITAVITRDAGRLVMERSAIRDTSVGPDPDETGRGVTAQMGGIVELDHVVVERARDLAMFVIGAGTALTGRDVAIRAVSPRENGRSGRALEVTGGASATLERLVVEEVRDVAILAGEVGTAVQITDAIVRRTEAIEATGDNGRAIEIIQGASASIERAVFDENRAIAAFLRGEGTNVELTDVVISRTRPRAADDESGRAMEASLGATLLFTRVYVTENHDVAMLLTEGAHLTATDLVVHGTRSNQVTLLRGTGVAVQSGAVVSITRGRVSENREEGVLVLGEGTTFDATDLVVRDTESWEASGLAGSGLAAQNGALVTITRSLFEGNRNAGVLAYHAGTEVRLFDAAVHGTRFPSCEPMMCPAPASGFAAVVSGHLEATRFVVTTSELTGVQIDMGGQMDLHQGEISDNPIGAAVAEEGYDFSRLSDQVAYRNNGVNLDARSLPLPTAIDSVTGGT